MGPTWGPPGSCRPQMGPMLAPCKWSASWYIASSLQWRHNERDSVSNQQPHDCLLNRLFRRRSKKTSKLRVTGLCAGNSPGTGEFPAQMASNAENVSIWWRHHDESSSCIPVPSLSWKSSKFCETHINWQNTAILNSDLLHGTVHHPTKFQADRWNP